MSGRRYHWVSCRAGVGALAGGLSNLELMKKKQNSLKLLTCDKKNKYWVKAV